FACQALSQRRNTSLVHELLLFEESRGLATVQLLIGLLRRCNDFPVDAVENEKGYSMLHAVAVAVCSPSGFVPDLVPKDNCSASAKVLPPLLSDLLTVLLFACDKKFLDPTSRDFLHRSPLDLALMEGNFAASASAALETDVGAEQQLQKPHGNACRLFCTILAEKLASLAGNSKLQHDKDHSDKARREEYTPRQIPSSSWHESGGLRVLPTLSQTRNKLFSLNSLEQEVAQGGRNMVSNTSVERFAFRSGF
ncbi:unnamed protein product, partial [Amoebophrya sp. A120]